MTTSNEKEKDQKALEKIRLELNLEKWPIFLYKIS